MLKRDVIEVTTFGSQWREFVPGPQLESDLDWMKCPLCGMRFEPNKAYGYVCPQTKCPIQPKAVC